jgi:hypothetical protein
LQNTTRKVHCIKNEADEFSKKGKIKQWHA